MSFIQLAHVSSQTSRKNPTKFVLKVTTEKFSDLIDFLKSKDVRQRYADDAQVRIYGGKGSGPFQLVKNMLKAHISSAESSMQFVHLMARLLSLLAWKM